MAEWRALPLLFSGDASADAARIVAFEHGAAVPFESFRRQVLAWRCRFRREAGTRVALHAESSLSFAAALFGAWHAGKIVTLPGDVLPDTLERLRTVVDAFAGDLPDGLQPDFAHGDAGDDVLRPLDLRSTRLVIYTSGSSGEPAAVEKRLHQLDSEIASLESRFGVAIDGATIHGTVSHQHIYGLLFRVLWPLAAGRPFAAQRLAYPEQIAATLDAQPSVLVSSPAHLKRLSTTIDWRAMKPGLRAVFSSGGPLPPEASASVHRLWGVVPVEVFGSTETGGIASRQGSTQAWSPLRGVDWRIDGETLAVRSAHLPDAQWFVSADRAVAVEQGFVLVGRADRIVKIEERRISLTAIERGLQASPLVHEARTLLLTGERTVVAAVCRLTHEGRDLLASAGKRVLVQKLRDILAGSIDAIALPRRWRFVETLPVDTQGKVTEARLAVLFKPLLPRPDWQSRTANTVSLNLDVDAELAVFDGHFPITPVLPGVALLDWAIRLGREAFALQRQFARMDVLKFQLLVRPGTRLNLQLDWQENHGALAFRYTSELGAHASGRVLFTALPVAAEELVP
ncbi:AMP-binding protein [Arenimonas oryziterrae]|uniref:Uncharacterized protein n=1 Tax=Arenimonas oryziterrae DSM 21050 = YC6267 TaxID=1121015 RepID=A0A091AUB0_9GAMM|nr:AMP-binding protein [Arenimonas oryziterrae]KFN42936.1 hypothetical protein N789_12495 [Arenimonas oryziterrae DSM 21050 = YC6267]